MSATTQQAIDEAQQNPASPIRAPPPPQQEAPRTPERIPPPPEVPELTQEQLQRLRQLEDEAAQAPLPPDNSEDEDFMA